MHNGAGVTAPLPARADRLALAVEAGALPVPDSGPIVALRAEDTRLYAQIGTGRFACEQGFRPVHDRLAAAGLTVAPALETLPESALALVTLTRQRSENLANVARALDALRPGGTLAVAGAKTDGVDAVMRQVAAVLPLGGSWPKAHGRVFWLGRPQALPAVVADWRAAYALRPNRDGFVTGPGMFSPEEIDAGSARLAAAFDARIGGRVADLGAGWGWLAARALAGSPRITHLDLFEAEARAVEAARANLHDARATVHWRDVLALGRPDEPYDWVITNPPLHQGRAAEPELGLGFIAAAARILKPTGHLILVANRQLPYERALAKAFATHEKLAEDRSFKLILAGRPVRH